MRRALALLVLVASGSVLVSTATVPTAFGSPVADAPASSLYVVTLGGAPLSSYDGGIPGYPATTPKPGQRFDDHRPAVRAYRDYLLQQQEQVLRAIGDPDRLYSYTTALDGFAATLTADQVRALESTPEVTSVEPSRILPVDDAGQGPADAKSGAMADGLRNLWRQVGGPGRAGRGVVVGIIDSGIWPENPSFAGVPLDPARLAKALPGFTGRCETGVRWTVDMCNSKIVSARYFVRGFGAANVAEADYLSPRDGSGHGSHAAAVAAGNDGVDVRIGRQDLGLVSGVAPAARLSIYKACWSAPDPSGDGCSTADTVKAVDQAVSDGVDVLNYSIGGSTTGDHDAVDMAFLNAAAAGVFVTTSAGNGGPDFATVASQAPWVTTVGASVDRVYQGAVQLGDGQTFVGAMLADHNVGPAPLVDAGRAAAAGVAARRAALCYPGSLDATQVQGAIVVCKRGVTARVSKSLAVARAGGTGMVLLNTEAGTLDPDSHRVPTVHVGVAAGQAIHRYVAGSHGFAMATLVAAGSTAPRLPSLARFSSRGPTGDGAVLKPDLVAPGANVVAAVAPPADLGRLWDLQSGTSTAAPFVAGLAAVARAAHPGWSSALVKSALMTTAAPLRTGEGPLARGAGQADPARYLDPGLGYDTTDREWANVLWGHASHSSVFHPTRPADLNLPSIAVPGLLGHKVVTRSVTNVSDHAETYTADIRGLVGVNAIVTPSTFTLRPGRSQTFTVSLTASSQVQYGQYDTGVLTWHGSLGHEAASPIVVRPRLVVARQHVSAALAARSATLPGRAGEAGALRIATSGLVGSVPLPVRLSPGGDFDPLHPTTSTGAAVESFAVPEGTAVARVEMQSASKSGGVDIFVYRDGRPVASSLAPNGGTTIQLTHPAAGSYRVYVAGTGPGQLRGELTCWVVPRAGADNLELTPRPVPVTAGEHFAVTASWGHLDRAKRWFGYVRYLHSPATTYLSVG